MKTWPNEDKPREKLILHGVQTLTDAELLAIFIRTGVKGQSALDIAKSLIKQHGTIKNLLTLPKLKIMQIQSIGQAKYSTLLAAIELGRRFLNANITPGTMLNQPLLAQNFLCGKLQDMQQEVFACIFLDIKLRVISYEEMFKGTIDHVTIHPREVLKSALKHQASKLILAHNHPSGDPTPSLADKELTILLQKALRLVDIDLVDHIIIGRNQNFSFNDKGLI